MDLSHPPLAAPSVPAKGNDIDRQVRAALARTTGSLSVASGLLATGDWAMNLAVSPGKRMELALLSFDYATQVARYEWLRAHSGKPVKPPRMGLPREHPLGDAPGRYVLEK